ncbi:MAG TPA: hypothetical protein VFD91_16650 [Mariniphaga sp.]|nr:hypothetical protein [Mariniphaga sp.]
MQRTHSHKTYALFLLRLKKLAVIIPATCSNQSLQHQKNQIPVLDKVKKGFLKDELKEVASKMDIGDNSVIRIIKYK